MCRTPVIITGFLVGTGDSEVRAVSHGSPVMTLPIRWWRGGGATVSRGCKSGMTGCFWAKPSAFRMSRRGIVQIILGKYKVMHLALAIQLPAGSIAPSLHRCSSLLVAWAKRFNGRWCVPSCWSTVPVSATMSNDDPSLVSTFKD
jgi:hypothetical protein